MAKANGKKQVITVDGSVVTVSYPTIHKAITIDVSQFADEVKFEAMIHGFKQKYGDAESGGEPAEKFDMVERLVESHKAGSWDLTSKSGPSPELVIAAVMRVMKKTREEMDAVIEAYGDEGPNKIKEWRAAPQVKAAMLKIQSERAIEAAKSAEPFKL